MTTESRRPDPLEPDDPLEVVPVPGEVPSDHPLRELFREITRRAFGHYRALHDPAVEIHIVDEILSEFVHVDRLHRVRDDRGAPITDLADFGRAARRSSGLERDLEIHQHAGDFALFMAGLFPESLDRRRPLDLKPLVVCVGSRVISLDRPRDYYVVEGTSAYGHVSRLYERLDPPRSGIFHRLSMRFEDYLGVMSLIRGFLRGAAAPGAEGGLIR